MNLNRKKIQFKKHLKVILSLCKKLIRRLELDEYRKAKDFSFIQSSRFYFNIYSNLFPQSDFLSERNNVNYFMLEDNQQIQYLINYLAEEVLKTELDHIHGEEIYRGNVLHVKKFLEILVAVTKSIME